MLNSCCLHPGPVQAEQGDSTSKGRDLLLASMSRGQGPDRALCKALYQCCHLINMRCSPGQAFTSLFTNGKTEMK